VKLLLVNESVEIRELQIRFSFYEDMKAYRQLYDLLFDSLYRFALHYVKSSEAAEEIVSDVFVKLWQISSKLGEIQNLKVYLFTITRNFSLNYITKNFKHPHVSIEDTDVDSAIAINNIEDSFISADLIKQIRNTIQQLPPQSRIIFQLVKEEGLKYREVAAILNISVLTVRNQVAIATRKIGETLPMYLRSSERVAKKI
jgi:RNA polymerase sigma-70 factor (family 1)